MFGPSREDQWGGTQPSVLTSKDLVPRRLGGIMIMQESRTRKSIEREIWQVTDVTEGDLETAEGEEVARML